MGVPAYFRWLSEKYPKIVIDILEKRSVVIDGIEIPVNLDEENPNGFEWDNLFVDMNGLIHPCSHPEDREAPTSEEEMYVNITKYVDRLMAAVRPRRVLFLAIDGVAPRAKMNQQRQRRFRAAQDAKERQKMLEEVKEEMIALGMAPSRGNGGGEWDSNVITPGTEFMSRLSEYIWFYVLDRMNSNPGWRNIKVVFSDASEPGEGEHKIMDFIRCQRSQVGYDPNQSHVLHGLDADLIMLALATHEPHFFILREKVFFGKKDRDLPVKSDGQRLLDQQTNRQGALISSFKPEDEWLYGKPLQAVQIRVLREYLFGEFRCLESTLPFKYDFERVIDDYVFMCFFVGNDFLPHLPSLDIRDGAIDFLMECYKQLLPSLGDYLTFPGGNVNLAQVDVILAKVGEIEDEIFQRKKEAEEMEDRRRAHQNSKKPNNQQFNNRAEDTSNLQIREAKPVNQSIGLTRRDTGPTLSSELAEARRTRAAETAAGESVLGKRSIEEIVMAADEKEGGESSVEIACVPVEENSIEDLEDSPTLSLPIQVVTESCKEELKARLKAKESARIDHYKDSIQDNIKLHESGWKQRYYDDNFKKDDIAQGGGLQKMCVSYVQGLCWVLKYYYEGCPSWNWYYPFHYAPFASDLINIDRYAFDFEKSKPFRPIEQLLAVLPADSVHALPEECRWLMTEASSPIIDIYLADVPLDPNGKHLPWLWVLLLPFVDELRITTAFNDCKEQMKISSRRRNAFGHPHIFVHKKHALGAFLLNEFENATSTLVYAPGKESDSEVLALLRDGESAELFPSEVTVEASVMDYGPEVGQGTSGRISHAIPSFYAPLDIKISAPKHPVGAFRDISCNRVLCLGYEFPSCPGHQSILLQGLVLPAPLLSPHDLISRIPRLSKGRFNLLDILNGRRRQGQAQGHGGRQQQQYQSQQPNYQYQSHDQGQSQHPSQQHSNAYGHRGATGNGNHHQSQQHEGNRGYQQQQQHDHHQSSGHSDNRGGRGGGRGRGGNDHFQHHHPQSLPPSRNGHQGHQGQHNYRDAYDSGDRFPPQSMPPQHFSQQPAPNFVAPYWSQSSQYQHDASRGQHLPVQQYHQQQQEYYQQQQQQQQPNTGRSRFSFAHGGNYSNEPPLMGARGYPGALPGHHQISLGNQPSLSLESMRDQLAQTLHHRTGYAAGAPPGQPYHDQQQYHQQQFQQQQYQQQQQHHQQQQQQKLSLTANAAAAEMLRRGGRF